MLVKLVKDIVKTQTVTFGEVDMILGSTDYSRLNVAICPNIRGVQGTQRERVKLPSGLPPTAATSQPPSSPRIRITP